MRALSIILAILAAFSATSCSRPRELVLPPGDAARGRDAFITLQCHECHRVDAVADLPPPLIAPDRVVLLGGEVTRLRTYDALVTSIIHPDAAISERAPRGPAGAPKTSAMRAVNDRMTVAELVDLVSFLLPRYRQIPPPDWSDFHGP